MIINADNDIDHFFDVVADTKGCGRKYVDAVVGHGDCFPVHLLERPRCAC